MKSSLPKVLHPACGRPLVYYPTRAALDLGANRVIVVGNPATTEAIFSGLSKHISTSKFEMVVQEVPRGTGDAARAGTRASGLGPTDRVLILSGDTPLLRASDLRPLIEEGERPTFDLCFMTFLARDPTGYGRVFRDAAGRPTEIREHRDLESEAQRRINEVNAGVYCATAGPLLRALSELTPKNAQGEFYLTDIVPKISETGEVRTATADEQSLLGVNDRAQLSFAESVLHERIRQRWGESGVTIVGHPLIDDSVNLQPEVRIEDNVRLRGTTRIGARTVVDVGTVIDSSVIGEDTNIKSYCVITDSQVGSRVQLGPFAHLRPMSILEDETHVGNFVETKQTTLRRGAKANHLSYLGDAEVGEKANIGAGTIVCNYDGFRKQRTTIGAGAFIGSDSQLIAPVTVGARAYVATATTVTKDVPEGALAIGRTRQENKEGYGDRLRERLVAEVAREKAAKTNPE
jgi:bifunctional UDP-N-acetylglucosamine pyrophosphorylase/glucosamine-1-phosphate N-acetyltransferase